MSMDWIDWGKFEKPKDCYCSDVRIEACTECVDDQREFVARQTIERCAKEAENTQDVCDCADRIAARIREAQV